LQQEEEEEEEEEQGMKVAGAQSQSSQSSHPKVCLVHWVTKSANGSNTNTVLAVTGGCEPSPEF
jgi:hypothetical protein